MCLLEFSDIIFRLLSEWSVTDSYGFIGIAGKTQRN